MRTAGIDPSQVLAAAGSGGCRHRASSTAGPSSRTAGTSSANVAGLLDQAIRPLWEPAAGYRLMTAVLITGIGELVTNDPTRGALLGIVGDAAVVVEDGRIAWLGRAARAACRRPAARPRRPSRAFPDSSTPTPTWSSPVSDRRSSAARMAGRALRRRRYRDDGRRHARRRRRHPAVASPAPRPGRPRPVPRGRPRSRSRAATAWTSPRRLDCSAWPREVTTETTFLGAHIVPAGHRPRHVHRARQRADARRLRAARPVDRRLLRAPQPARVRRRPGAPRPAWRARRRGWGCGSTATSSAPAPGPASRSSSGRPASTTARISPAADVAALATRLDRRDAAAGRGVLHPLALSGRPRPARRGRHRRAGHGHQPGHVLDDQFDAVRDRPRRPGVAHDPGRGRLGRDGRRGRGAAPRRRRRAPGGRRGPTSRSSTPRPTSTSPTAPASPSPGHST